jgi:ligand-binding sensor domain-containing protein
MRNFIILCSLLLQTLFCEGQVLQRITVDQGLLTNSMTTIIRDRNNFMWVASMNGLHKHEGSRIKVYNRTGTDSLSISSTEIHGLFEDRQGYIWIGTTAGLDKLDPVTGLTRHFPIHLKSSGTPYIGYIYAVSQDKEDYIWATTDAGIFRIDYKSGAFVLIPETRDATGIPYGRTGYKTGISTDKGIWIHNDAGMIFYEYSTRKFYHRYHNPDNKPIFNAGSVIQPVGANSDMAVDRDSNLYFVMNHSWLGCYNLRTEKLDSFAFQRPPIAWRCCNAVTIDQYQNVWIGFRHGGILVFNSSSKTFSSISYKSHNSLLNSNYIYSLCEDYTGKMWVTTDKGIDIIDFSNTAIQKKQLSEDQDLEGNSYITGLISADPGRIYIPLSEGGLLSSPPDGSSFTRHRFTDTAIKRILYVYNDKKEGLIAAVNGGLAKLEIRGEHLYTRMLSTSYAKELLSYRGTVAWMHRVDDSSIFFKKTNGIIYHYNGSDSLEKIQSDGFRLLACLSKDEKHLYYIANGNQLIKRELRTQKKEVFPMQEKLKALNYHFYNPRSLAEDGQGNIWISSQNGMVRYQLASGKIFTYTTKNGLSQNFSFATCVDTKGRFFAGSLGGVDYYDPGSDRFRNVISHASGTYMDAFGSALRSTDDHLVFVSGNNIFRIQPDSFLTRTTQPFQLKITDILLNGVPVDTRNPSALTHLRYKQNRIQFSFALLDFHPSPNTKYYYYLEGAEETWFETSRPEISYSSLAPGKYIFHLKAVDQFGNGIQQQIEFPVRIAPPFWKTWWFRVLFLLTIAGLIYWLFKRRIRDIQSKSALRQQMTELEAKALRAQMNPHFIFNSLNAIQELIVTKNFKEAYLYLSSFSKLLRMVLNNSEKNFIPLSSEIEMNKLYLSLESLRFKQSFHYEIRVDPAIDEESCLVPALLLQPFLENAIWHGLLQKEGEKNLLLSYHLGGIYLVCVIEDNGIGRSRAREIKAGKLGAVHFESKGMSLSEQRIETLGRELNQRFSIQVEDLMDVSGKAAGTRVTVLLPQKQNT